MNSYLMIVYTLKYDGVFELKYNVILKMLRTTCEHGSINLSVHVHRWERKHMQIVTKHKKEKKMGRSSTYKEKRAHSSVYHIKKKKMNCHEGTF